MCDSALLLHRNATCLGNQNWVTICRLALTTLVRISSLRGEELASTTSLPDSLEITGFSTMVLLSAL